MTSIVENNNTLKYNDHKKQMNNTMEFNKSSYTSNTTTIMANDKKRII